jgi:hypothetical protein
MLARLLKHEFRSTRRIIPWIYLVTICMGLFSLLVRTLGVKWLSDLFLFLMVAAGAGAVLMTYVLVIYRYYKNLYNSEGYLTHTLPVDAGRILASKIIVSFFWLLASYLVMAGVLLTAGSLVLGEQGMTLAGVIRQFMASSGLPQNLLVWLVIAVAAYACLSILYFISQVFFAITLGNTSRFHSYGIGGPILLYLATNFTVQIGTLVFMTFIPAGIVFRNGAFSFVPQGMLATFINQNEGVFGLGSILFILIATVGLLIWTERLIRRSTSLR